MCEQKHRAGRSDEESSRSRRYRLLTYTARTAARGSGLRRRMMRADPARSPFVGHDRPAQTAATNVAMENRWPRYAHAAPRVRIIFRRAYAPVAAKMPEDASDRPVRNRPRSRLAGVARDQTTAAIAATPEVACRYCGLRPRVSRRGRDAVCRRGVACLGAVCLGGVCLDAACLGVACGRGESRRVRVARAADRRDRSLPLAPRNCLRRGGYLVRSVSRSRRSTSDPAG